MAAGELGAMAADARRRDLEVITRFAKNLGLAFQISDDLLDVLGTPEETGKDAGQDAGKVTFVKLLGVEGAQDPGGRAAGLRRRLARRRWAGRPSRCASSRSSCGRGRGRGRMARWRKLESSG